jgi:Protein of unknown function (DUF3105)
VAKKKSRVPTPPRKVDVPKSRQAQAARVRATTGQKGPSLPGTNRNRLVLIILAAVVVVVAIIVGVIAFTGGSDANASSELAAAGCTDESLPDQGRNHVQTLPEGFHYNSYPPTSGPHNPNPALWGFYDRPVPFITSTHNLEHGGIVIRYGENVPQETIDQIRAWYNQDPNGILVAPLTGNALNDKVALTAWTHLAVCPGFNATAFNAFRDAYRGNGPERFPVSSLQPGT